MTGGEELRAEIERLRGRIADVGKTLVEALDEQDLAEARRLRLLAYVHQDRLAALLTRADEKSRRASALSDLAEIDRDLI